MLGKDFLAISDLDRSEMEELLRRAIEGKKEWKEGRAKRPLKNKVLGMIFHKPSLRTRVSFDVGAHQLGGTALYFTEREFGLGSRESVKDVGQVLGRYLDGVMIRTFAHGPVVELAKNTPIPIINGLTDLLHPCQIMADLQTILEHRKSLDDMTVAFFGDGNNVAHSWINAAGVLPFRLRVAVPEGFEPDDGIVAAARARGAGEIEVLHDPKEAAKDADVLYTDVWASMGQESEKEARAKIMAPFRLNQALVEVAKKSVLVLHCLPAHRGEEITDEVIDGPHSVVFDEAENRLHAQKAIMERLMG
ncbi:MAG: ornithine carbamoyltransferase [Candidatus Eisenbacteria bacterium]